MKQSEMLKELKELHSDLLRYAAGSDSIVPGAYAEALDAAIETLDRIRWISVKDILPENDNYVLCCTETKKGTKNVIIGYYMDGAWRCGMNSNVTHWMPLPELPEGENNG